jgi:hypothetical protein
LQSLKKWSYFDISIQNRSSDAIAPKFKWVGAHVSAGQSHYDRTHPVTTVRGRITERGLPPVTALTPPMPPQPPSSFTCIAFTSRVGDSRGDPIHFCLLLLASAPIRSHHRLFTPPCCPTPSSHQAPPPPSSDRRPPLGRATIHEESRRPTPLHELHTGHHHPPRALTIIHCLQFSFGNTTILRSSAIVHRSSPTQSSMPTTNCLRQHRSSPFRRVHHHHEPASMRFSPSNSPNRVSRSAS